eukprot:COSAG04_NODE_17300_length_473_cov_0.620321_1_plen_33_part_10
MMGLLGLPPPLLLLAAARGAWAQSPSCAAADFR